MGMDNERELNRLAEMYDENTDDELLHMDARRDDLTELAQEALSKVMQQRRLSPVTIVQNDAEAALAQQMVDDSQLAPDEVGLFSFDDMYQASRAVELMKQAGIDYRMIDRTQRMGDSLRGRVNPVLWMIVKQRDRGRAENLLRDEMQLFPPPETDSATASDEAQQGMELLSMFDLESALEAAHALGEGGISYLWRDGRDPREGLPDAETIAIEVHADKLEEANELVDQLGDAAR